MKPGRQAVGQVYSLVEQHGGRSSIRPSLFMVVDSLIIHCYYGKVFNYNVRRKFANTLCGKMVRRLEYMVTVGPDDKHASADFSQNVAFMSSSLEGLQTIANTLFGGFSPGRTLTVEYRRQRRLG